MLSSGTAVAISEQTQEDLQAPYEAAMAENLKVPLEVARMMLIVNQHEGMDMKELEENQRYFEEWMENCWRIKVKVVATFYLDASKTNFQAERIFAPYSMVEGEPEWEKLLRNRDLRGINFDAIASFNNWEIDGVIVYDRDLDGLEGASFGQAKYYSSDMYYRQFSGLKRQRILQIMQLRTSGMTLHGLGHDMENGMSLLGLERISAIKVMSSLPSPAQQIFMNELKD
jgi:hypothetical protein